MNTAQSPHTASEVDSLDLIGTSLARARNIVVGPTPSPEEARATLLLAELVTAQLELASLVKSVADNLRQPAAESSTTPSAADGAGKPPHGAAPSASRPTGAPTTNPTLQGEEMRVLSALCRRSAADESVAKVWDIYEAMGLKDRSHLLGLPSILRGLENKGCLTREFSSETKFWYYLPTDLGYRTAGVTPPAW